jgi:23S rRNA (cytosine1962-C5)-methyltransferase
MLVIRLKKNEERRIKNGHPWVFSNEIDRIEGSREAGAAAELYDNSGALLGCGHYNPHSLIAFRLLSRRREDLDSSSFYEQRIRAALAYRQRVCPGLTTLRVVYGESDYLPGLVVDKYGDYLSLQILSAGMERRRALLLEALVNVYSPAGIIARNDVSVRSLEGLAETVDLRHGQKTGGFLDQKRNHLLLESLCRDKTVLDCFCYSGSWAVHAAYFGAASVVGLDISAPALAMANRNAALNGLEDRVRFEESDVFERLRTLGHEGKRFDVVIMDPPAFVKSRKTIGEATKGYLTVNRRALELLNPGGYLITCSCSYHMGREPFRDLLTQAARLARRDVRLLATCSQAPDHPVLMSFPESEYLKCFVLQAVG